MNYLLSAATISTALLLGACGSGSDGGDAGDDIGANAGIAGLWDLTEVDPVFGEDIVYLQIMADGTTIIYDYQQDEFDAGDNCYFLDTGQTFTSIGGNQYNSEIAGFPDEAETITITRSGNVLTVSYVDIDDENDNGNVTETLSDTYPLLTGVDPAFNECA